MYNVLIADDNIEFTNSLTEILSTSPHYQIVAALTNGLEVISQMELLRPDILILDIVMPGTDGINIVAHARQRMTDYDPIIYIVSGIGSTAIIKALSALNIDFFSMKPVALDLILHNLNTITKVIQIPDQAPPHKETAPVSEEIRIKQFMIQLGLRPHLRSSKCLYSALLYCLEHPDGTLLITKGLYPSLAKKYDLTNAAVERRLRHAIEIIQKNKTPLYHKVFSYAGDKKITNGEFLGAVTEYFQSYY